MKISNHIISLLAILLLNGCDDQKELVVEIPAEEPKLVINCLYSADTSETIYISVHKSRMIYESDSGTGIGSNYTFKKIENAQVELFPQIFFDTIGFNDGFYKFNIKNLPVVDVGDTTYTLRVSVAGFDTIEVSNTLPPKVNILDSYISAKGGIYDEEGDEFGEITIEFQDDISTDNFYNISVFVSPTPLGGIHFVDFKSTDPVASDVYRGGFLDERLLLFNDELFNGKKYALKILLLKEYIGSAEKIQVHLSTLSKEYYLYVKTVNLKQEREYNTFPSEPVQVYSNIKDGYGIFAGYNAAVVDTVRME